MTNTTPRMTPLGLRLLASAALFLLAVATPAARATDAPAPAAKAPAAKPSGPVPPEAMDGMDFTGLTPAQKDLAVSIMNENGCDCGCGMKVAVCRRDDAKCGRSLALGKQVIELAKQGKGRDEIVKAALTPPTKFVQFDLKPGDAPAVGPADAKVVLLQYLDYQCPFCARIWPTTDQILKDYPKDVRIVFKMHPLAFHPNAEPAAEAALAAAAQGKFMEMSAKLFENQQKLTRDTFLAIAKDLGLDVDKFTKDIDGKVYAAEIARQTKEVEDIGGTGTPATFVNGRYVSGAKPIAFFKELIDEELGWAKAGNRPQFKTGKNVSETAVKQPGASGPDPNKIYTIAAGSSPARGPADAKVTIYHFYDYQCPFCVRVAPTLEQLLTDYPKDLRVVYKQHPLSMHPNAMISAQGALAAAAQGKFHEMSEKLFVAAPTLTRDKLIELAKSLGLDVDKFTKDLDSPAIRASIDADVKEALAAGATGTPASFVNGRFVNGAAPIASFKQIIDAELAKSTATK